MKLNDASIAQIAIALSLPTRVRELSVAGTWTTRKQYQDSSCSSVEAPRLQLGQANFLRYEPEAAKEWRIMFRKRLALFVLLQGRQVKETVLPVEAIARGDVQGLSCESLFTFKRQTASGSVSTEVSRGYKSNGCARSTSQQINGNEEEEESKRLHVGGASNLDKGHCQAYRQRFRPRGGCGEGKCAKHNADRPSAGSV
ncbi:hypothetical protein BASA62_003427 [Batrachochytrium salamandrivorans]|nr:hypothetical protein BASA62_003427 [Batrachochytrium salamandrivorans]